MKLETAAEILGVSGDSSMDDVLQIYRSMAAAWHPEKVCKDSIVSIKQHFHHIVRVRF